MLQQLLQYAQAANIKSEPGFSTKRVHWAMNVASDGTYLGLEDLRQGKAGKEYLGCPFLTQPELIGGGADNPRSHFLVESAEALLGYTKKDEDDHRGLEKIAKKQAYFIELLERVAIEEPRLSWMIGATRFLRNEEEISRAKSEFIGAKGAVTDLVVIVVESKNPLDTNDWHDWWRSFRAELGASSKDKQSKSKKAHEVFLARDLMTGELISPALTHPKIKGLAGIGGLGTGDSLISFDKSAFQSYGLEKSANAALSEESAACYVDALNKLIDNSEQLAGTKICYWFSKKEENDLFDILLDPSEFLGTESSDVKKLIQSLRSGERSVSFTDRYFYLNLSGCSGRVMVRDWCEGSMQDLKQAVAAWFDDLSIVSRQGDKLAPPPKFWTVLACLYRDPSKEIPPPLAQDLFRRAITNRQLPQSILALALRRLHSELVDSEGPPLNHTRMGLIKAYLNRKNGECIVDTYLRTDHPDPAYHCGRLLAVLAKLQRAALGDVGAGVVQRYYAATSQTPALTFGRLLANAQNHLDKLSGGLAHIYNEKLASILGQIDSVFPQTLSLERQSLFALGYYQQIAEMDRQRQANIEKKKNEQEGVDTNESH